MCVYYMYTRIYIYIYIYESEANENENLKFCTDSGNRAHILCVLGQGANRYTTNGPLCHQPSHTRTYLCSSVWTFTLLPLEL